MNATEHLNFIQNKNMYRFWRQNVNWKKYFRIIGIWLNVAPHYKVVSGKINQCRYCKINASIKLILLLTVYYICVINYEYKEIRYVQRYIDYLLDFVDSTFCFLMAGVTIAKSAFGEKITYVNYNANVDFIAGFLSRRKVTKQRSNVIFHCYVLIYAVIMFIIAVTESIILKFLTHIFFFIFFYYLFYTYTFIMAFAYIWNVLIIKRFYEDFNVYIHSINYYIKNGKITDTKLYLRSKRTVISHKINASLKVYKRLLELVQSLNKMYAVQLLVISFQFSTAILYNFNIVAMKTFRNYEPLTPMGFKFIYIIILSVSRPNIKTTSNQQF